MGAIKYSLFVITAMLFLRPVFGQPKILLLDKYYRCNGCALQRPPVLKSQIVKDIKEDSLLKEAWNKIIRYFTSEGDRFALHCPSCPLPLTRYVHNTQAKPGSYKGLGTDPVTRRGGNQKGGDDFYQMEDVVSFLTDSILVFDSLQLSTVNIIARDQPLLGNMRLSYRVNGQPVERRIAYDPERQVLSLSYQSVFGKQLSRRVTDTLSIALRYLNADNQGVTARAAFKVFFASEEEKKDMADWVDLCEQEFPEWTPKQRIETLFSLLTARYKNASLPNFIQWLSKQQ